MTGIETSLDVAGYRLQLVEEGTLEPAALQKNNRQTAPSNYTPTSSSSSASGLDQHQRNAFNPPSAGGASVPDQDARPTTLTGSDGKPGQATQKAIYEKFIAAVLLTVSVGFCRSADALPLNYRTVLLAPSLRSQDSIEQARGNDDLVLGSFRAYLTTTGALLVSIGVSVCRGLDCLRSSVAKQIHPVQSILAAPFGLLAYDQQSYAADFGSASLVNTPNTQMLSVRSSTGMPNSQWRETCLNMLQLRGVDISLLRETHWINLRVAKNRAQDLRADVKHAQLSSAAVAIPWPAPLCFRRRRVEIASTSLVGQTMLSGHEENHDALGDAGAWHNASEEREEKASKRKIDRTVASTKEVQETDSAANRPSAPSPLALRRPSTATAAAGTMYPTPPDGIQQFNGVTPSIDDATSSPANPIPTSTVPDLEPTSHPDHNGEDFGASHDYPEVKRDRSDSNLLNDAENMFGDMGGDMFGDNDITEADFNFFDEQPDSADIDIPMADPTPVEVQKPPPPPEEIPPKSTVEEEVAPSVPLQPATENDSVVFAKPELKHARSSLVDNNTLKKQASKVSPAMKRESSPFNSQTVYKRVRASLTASAPSLKPTLTSPDAKSKTFGRINLGSALPVINKKYEQGGMFDYSKSFNAEKAKSGRGMLPEADYLKRNGIMNSDQKARLLAVGTLVKGITELEVPSSNPSPRKLDAQDSDGDEDSIESGEDDVMMSPDESGSPMKAGFRSGAIEDDVVSHVTSVREMDFLDEPDPQLVIDLPRAMRSEMPEHFIPRFFADPEPPATDVALNDNDLIQIAQLLTEQAATGRLDVCGLRSDETAESFTRSKRQSLMSNVRKSLQALEGIMPPIFGFASPLRLKALLDIQDIPLVGQPNRLQPRPIPGRDLTAEQLRPSNLYQIPGPHLEVRRSESRLSVLPSAIGFWESLGLAPSSGNKDVRAICVFPGWKGVAENVSTFLERMKSIYELLKLGSFENAPLPGGLQEGILPYEVDRISTSPDTASGHGSALMESVETLRGAISELTAIETNVVIYFVYSPSNPRTLIEACTAFQRLFESYQKQLALRREVPQNELVLQLISMDFLSSPSSLVIPSPSELMRICIETYDRCTLFNGPMPAPAIRLEEPLPRMIDFKLTSAPSASLMKENSCIHVAYAQSVDDRWVTAAWTDDRGNQQATASYCLARRGKAPSTTMDEVAHEIWESTLDLVSSCKVHWRVIVTKCSPMDQHEIEFWTDLARTEIKASMTLTLMTVDTAPSLQLIPPPVNLAPTMASFYTTPVSTPQANIVSPEQTATPATPMREANAGGATPGADSGAEAESDAVLIDVTDQTWGSVVGHRLGNPAAVLDLQPALLSGYLIKRTGNKMEDAPAVMEINLIHTDATPRSYEPLLREMLSNFRGLGTLARARGVVDRDTDIRPWHVAAAEKAVRALYLLM